MACCTIKRVLNVSFVAAVDLTWDFLLKETMQTNFPLRLLISNPGKDV